MIIIATVIFCVLCTCHKSLLCVTDDLLCTEYMICSFRRLPRPYLVDINELIRIYIIRTLLHSFVRYNAIIQPLIFTSCPCSVCVDYL